MGAQRADPRVGTWLVRRDSGIRIVESWDHLGMRASGSHEVLFEEVAVPLENAIGLHPRPASGAGPGRAARLRPG